MASDTPRFCTHCGASLAADAKFCAQCGSAVVAPAPETPQEVAKAEPPEAGAVAPAADRDGGSGGSGGSGCAGCLAALGVSVAALGLPLLFQWLFNSNRSPNGAFIIVAPGVLAFWGLVGEGWGSGKLFTGRRRGLARGESPVGFFIGLWLYALAGLGMYLLYLGLVFSL